MRWRDCEYSDPRSSSKQVDLMVMEQSVVLSENESDSPETVNSTELWREFFTAHVSPVCDLTMRLYGIIMFIAFYITGMDAIRAQCRWSTYILLHCVLVAVSLSRFLLYNSFTFSTVALPFVRALTCIMVLEKQVSENNAQYPIPKNMTVVGTAYNAW